MRQEFDDSPPPMLPGYTARFQERTGEPVQEECCLTRSGFSLFISRVDSRNGGWAEWRDSSGMVQMRHPRLK